MTHMKRMLVALFDAYHSVMEGSEFGIVDHYNCLKFNIQGFTDTVCTKRFLERGLEHHGPNIKAAWVILEHFQLHLLSMCVELGFVMHHCNYDNSISLFKWMKATPCNIPEYSNHFIGVGGVVIDDQDNILVIQTRLQALRVIPWKLPGGYVETNESIGHAVVREVKEETGVDAEVIGILGFREMSNAPYGRRDIYFVVLMRPINHTISIEDVGEVSDCVWMPIHEWFEVSKLGESCRLLKEICSSCKTNVRDYLSSKTMSSIGQDWGSSRPRN
eukprot:CAMPEP_0204910100 /NCGR_PEP_ID=MMETSP1397-20131031/8684_1 /ASSEMBLY_ACC=CAM_ASM_000891 /TAXON_ID=49980 /ORGANISM="Climacostomum Climacostomum virens, Strain Stock W-24" /LENGTH=273 /DNA_ID=CAMNT_0052080133 /DNA_START=133 /DNA_END=952 /DNA_ORIENTATION=-